MTNLPAAAWDAVEKGLRLGRMLATYHAPEGEGRDGCLRDIDHALSLLAAARERAQRDADTYPCGHSRNSDAEPLACPLCAREPAKVQPNTSGIVEALEAVAVKCENWSVLEDISGRDFAMGRTSGFIDAASMVRDTIAKWKAAPIGPQGVYQLHPETEALVRRFADALGWKLAAAEQKYGYSDGWMNNDWMPECRERLLEHVKKGDPRDVAAYCAFLWHHGAKTYEPDDALALGVEPAKDTARPTWLGVNSIPPGASLDEIVWFVADYMDRLDSDEAEELVRYAIARAALAQPGGGGGVSGIERMTVRMPVSDLLSCIWYSDGSGAYSKALAEMPGCSDNWIVTAIELVGLEATTVSLTLVPRGPKESPDAAR